MLEQVAGQAFAALGYALQDNAIHHMRGLLRYRKPGKGGNSTYVEFQMLAYQQGLSRFRVNLLRSSGGDARSQESDDAHVEITLSRLLWEGFGVEQLGTPEFWWTFTNPLEMGRAIADAGKWAIAFGIPWLEGTLAADRDFTR
jgi:hypothetical protein